MAAAASSAGSKQTTGTAAASTYDSKVTSTCSGVSATAAAGKMGNRVITFADLDGGFKDILKAAGMDMTAKLAATTQIEALPDGCMAQRMSVLDRGVNWRIIYYTDMKACRIVTDKEHNPNKFTLQEVQSGINYFEILLLKDLVKKV